MADRDVAGAVRRGRQADAGELGDDAVDAVGLGIDRDIALLPRLGDPAVERASSVTVSYFERSTSIFCGLGSAACGAGLRSIAAMTSLPTALAPVVGASRRRPSG